MDRVLADNSRIKRSLRFPAEWNSAADKFGSRTPKQQGILVGETDIC